MKNTMLFLLLSGMLSVQAAPIRFDFVFQDGNSGAAASGYIVFEETLLDNPTNGGNVGVNPPDGLPPGFPGEYSIPGPEVLDLSFTVTGSQSADGDYGMDDYVTVILFTNGGTLNLNGELIGQSTDGSPWGTSLFDAGDFNLFSNDVGQGLTQVHYDAFRGTSVPDGCAPFTLCSGSDSMQLISMRGTPSVIPSVPATSNISLLALLISSLLIGSIFIRKS